MENKQNPPPARGSAEANDYSQYLIHSKAEIIQLLRAIMQKTEMVTAYFNQGKDFILTSILDVTDSHVTLDFGANPALNRKILDSDKVLFASAVDRVKVQFNAMHIEAVKFQQRDAFRVPLPQVVLKLQRREYYRISTPITQPIKCEIPLGNGKVNVSVADISIGGIGIIGCPPELQLDKGLVYPGCRIDLPDIGSIVATLEIRSILEVTLRSGATTQRSGCQFVNLPSAMQVLLQRYITKLERDRRAKIAGADL